jgi:hypothetical protein
MVIRGKTYEGCMDAEVHFGTALEQADTLEHRGHDRLWVFHDSDGNPLAFRKDTNESSSLLLEPFSDGSVTIPPGTIAAISTGHTKQTGGYSGQGFDLATHLVEGELRIAPVRLSAWTYPEEEDRSDFAVEWSVDVNQDRARLVVDNTLEDFVDAAEQIMEVCGVRQMVS